MDSKKEKELQVIGQALSSMSDMDAGRFLGIAEGMLIARTKENNEDD